MELYSATIIASTEGVATEKAEAARKLVDYAGIKFEPFQKSGPTESFIARTHRYTLLLDYAYTDHDELIVSLESSFLSDHSVIEHMAKMGARLIESGYDLEIGGRGQIKMVSSTESETGQKISAILTAYFEDFDRHETESVYSCMPDETSRIVGRLQNETKGILNTIAGEPKTMNIVFDMDNTLVDEFGATVRPGIVDLLKRLKADGHNLYLWTNSTKQRAISILREHKLMQFFTHCVYREDYDPENAGIAKDVLSVAASWLIDDDPAEISACRKSGVDGFLISPYRKGGKPNPKELNKIYSEIKRSNSFFRRLFR